MRAADNIDRMVLRALHDLAGRTGETTTAADIASYLELKEAAVDLALLALRRQRLARDRRRKGERVWEPWR